MLCGRNISYYLLIIFTSYGVTELIIPFESSITPSGVMIIDEYGHRVVQKRLLFYMVSSKKAVQHSRAFRVNFHDISSRTLRTSRNAGHHGLPKAKKSIGCYMVESFARAANCTLGENRQLPLMRHDILT